MFFVVMFIFLFVFVLNMIKIYFCHRWMNIEQKKAIKNTSVTCKFPLFLLIPVLNEQKIIRETYRHFKDLIHNFDNVYTVFVTTEKETTNTEKTYDIICDLIRNDNEDKIFVVNYPCVKGVMAHQLNYAVDFLKKRINTNDFWIGVYNADSRINVDTIKYSINKINTTKKEKYCMQQYSYYYCQTKRHKGLMQSCALWQSRWSITFEMARARMQLLISQKDMPSIFKIVVEKMNYIIGHGFFINANLLLSLGGLPQNTINEDACLGYLLNCNDIKILPIPFLELAESPNNMRVYLNQQNTWFNGPRQAFLYYSIYKSETLSTKARSFVFALKLFLHAIYWVGAPILLLLVCPLTIDSIAQLILWLIVIILHLPVTNMVVCFFLKRHTNKNDFIIPKASTMCILFYIFHCLGPLKNLWKQIKGENTIENKYKTER